MVLQRWTVISIGLMMLMGVAVAAPQNDLTSELDDQHQPNCGCGKRVAKRGRIVGGDELETEGAPWLAVLARRRKAHCGAALLSGTHLLTAAHCIDGITVAEMRVWMGIHSLAQAGLEMSARSLIEDGEDVGDGVGRTVKKAWPHPEFDSSTFRNDIAVLELQLPVKFSSHLYPICLPVNAPEDYGSRMAGVAGWGRTGEQLPPSDVPRQTMVEVWSNDQCQKSGYPRTRLRGQILCAGRRSGGLDACQGDSGGPLVLPGSNGEMEVIGIVSWGRGCARPNLPGVYTKVSSYLDFLKGIMQEACPNILQ